MKKDSVNGKNVVGTRLRQARERLSPAVSTAELSARLLARGVTLPSHVLATIEDGTRRVRDYELFAVAACLNTSVAWLIGEVEDADVLTGEASQQPVDQLRRLSAVCSGGIAQERVDVVRDGPWSGGVFPHLSCATLQPLPLWPRVPAVVESERVIQRAHETSQFAGCDGGGILRTHMHLTTHPALDQPTLEIAEFPLQGVTFFLGAFSQKWIFLDDFGKLILSH